jgi:hypothetical protein
MKIGESSGQGVRTEEVLRDAKTELSHNVTQVERATVVRGRPLLAHAAWLRRLYEIVVRAERALRAPEDAVAAAAAALDPIRLLPPLAVRGVLDPAPEKSKKAEATTDAHGERLMEVELAAIDHLLDAANDEAELLGRRRRLLEAARQMLLESQAAVALDEKGLEARRRYLAREIARLDRLEAQGLSPDVALTHQVREAVQRGERERLHAGILAIEAPALARGDERVLRLSREALRRLWNGHDPRAAAAKAESLHKSAGQVFGGEFADVVAKAYARGLRVYGQTSDTAPREEREAANIAAQYPFNRFDRLDFGLSWFNISRENIEEPGDPVQYRTVVLPSIAYTHDTSLWGYTSPVIGSRYKVSIFGTPKLGSTGLSFVNVTGDYRTYIRLGRNYSFALRLAGGGSFGRNPQKYIIGGLTLGSVK